MRNTTSQFLKTKGKSNAGIFATTPQKCASWKMTPVAERSFGKCAPLLPSLACFRRVLHLRRKALRSERTRRRRRPCRRRHYFTSSPDCQPLDRTRPVIRGNAYRLRRTQRRTRRRPPGHRCYCIASRSRLGRPNGHWHKNAVRMAERGNASFRPVAVAARAQQSAVRRRPESDAPGTSAAASMYSRTLPGLMPRRATMSTASMGGRDDGAIFLSGWKLLIVAVLVATTFGRWLGRHAHASVGHGTQGNRGSPPRSPFI